MKKIYIINAIVLAIGIYIVSSGFKVSGGHPSSTGAPGELSCAKSGCHSDAQVTKVNNQINSLSFSGGNSYVPGQTYTITLKAEKSGVSRFGFQIVALKNNDNKNAGEFIITNEDRTHIVTGSGSLISRIYVTHSAPGTTAISPGVNEWSFDWTAPSTDVGTVTFYYATNLTNNNGTNKGDAIYLSSFVVASPTTVGIYELLDEQSFNFLLDNQSDKLTLNYELKKKAKVSISLYDSNGKMIRANNFSYQEQGKHTDNIQLGQEISSGIYLINLNIDNQTLSKKIIIQ